MPRFNRELISRGKNRALSAMKDAVTGKPLEEGARAAVGRTLFQELTKDVPKALKRGLTVEQKIVKLHDDKIFMKFARAAGWTDGDIAGTVKGAADDYYARKERVAEVEATRKVGRNEPCPCGSGKKYKKCCGG